MTPRTSTSTEEPFIQKTPPKQYTVELQSVGGSAKEEFQRMQKFLEHRGVRFRSANSHPIGRGSFDFTLRLTETEIGYFLWAKHGAATIESAWSLPNKIKKRPVTLEPPRSLRLIFVISGERTQTRQGETRKLKAGDFVIVEGDSFEHFTANKGELFEILVSEDYFYTHAGFHADYFLNRIFSSETPLQRVFSRQIKLLAHDIALIDARDVPNLCDGIFCFLRTVLGELDRKEQIIVSAPDQLRARVFSVMEHRFRDPKLTMSEVAKEVGISLRYLNVLFEAVGTTPLSQLREIRLQRIAVQLKEDHIAHVGIAEIGRRNGIPHATYMGKLFKARYGVTPKTWRKENSTEK